MGANTEERPSLLGFTFGLVQGLQVLVLNALGLLTILDVDVERDVGFCHSITVPVN